MAKVPEYGLPQVEERSLPGARQESVATPGLLGGASSSLAAASAGAFNAGVGVSAVAFHMQERDNADKIFRAETSLKAQYLDFEADVREKRKGEFARGATKEAKDWWDKTGSEIAGTLDNDEQRRLFINRATALRMQSIDSVSKFEATQLDEAHDKSWLANKLGETNIAAANPTEPQVVLAADRIKKLNAYQAARKGWSPEVLEAQNVLDVTAMHKQVIQTLVSKNPDMAKVYFEAHKNEIAGAQRAEIGEFANKATAEAIGVRTAGEIWAQLGPKGDKDAANLDTLEEAARKQLGSDTFTLKATISNLRERYTAFNSGRAQRADALEGALTGAALKGAGVTQVRSLPEFAMLSATSPDKAQRIISFMENRAYTQEARAAARESRADSAESRKQRQITTQGWAKKFEYEDPNKLVSMTRDQVQNLLPDLGPQHTQDLLNRWDAFTKNGTALSEAKVDNDQFNTFAVRAGLNPLKKGPSEDEKVQLSQTRDRIEKMIGIEQQARKRPLTRDEKDKIMQREIDNTVLVKNRFWFGASEQPAVTLQPGSVSRAFVTVDGEDVVLSSIPAAEREKIIAARRRAGLPVTEKGIAEFYVRGKKKDK